LDLPKETLPSHDGKLATFYPFWLIFRERVIKNDRLDDVEKRSRLYQALCDVDRINTAGLSLKETEQYLNRRYRSENTVRTFLQQRFLSVQMKHPKDVEGAQQLADTLEICMQVLK